MCLFTHFAAGALVGGAMGQAGWAVVGGLASHAVLDVIPHYDFPDWRIEIAGGAAALLVLVLLPFSSVAAAVGGLAGMVPDLENLLHKLGRLDRRFFLFPTHTGLLPHGRRCSPRSLVWQGVLTVACFVLLGLLSPDTARAAAPGSDPTAAKVSVDPVESGWRMAGGSHVKPAAIIGVPRVLLVDGNPSATTLEFQFPAEKAPADWQRISPRQVQWRRPGSQMRTGADGWEQLPPRHCALVAVPTADEVSWQVASYRWWREPKQPVSVSSLVNVSLPGISRKVPLVTVTVSPEASEGGILANVTLVLRHRPSGRFATYLERDAGVKARVEAAHPAGRPRVANPQLFNSLSAGARQWYRERQRPEKDGEEHPFALTSNWVRLEIDETGVYGLTGMDLELAGVAEGNVDSRKLRLFKGGGLPIDPDPDYPDDQQLDRSGFTEVAIAVLDADEDWDGGDSIVFYAFGGDAWLDRLVDGTARLDRFEHLYAARGVYWLTWEFDSVASPFPGEPLRVETVAAPALGGEVVNRFQQRQHYEQSGSEANGLFADNWAWDTVIPPGLRGLAFTLPEAMPGTSTQFVIDIRSMVGRRTNSNYLNVAAAWLNEDGDHAVSTSWSARAQSDSLRVRLIGQSDALQTGLNRLFLENRNEPDSRPALNLALDSFDLLYWLPLSKGSEQLQFTHWQEQVSVAGPVDLQIALDSVEGITVWDVTTAGRPQALTGTETSTPSATLTVGLQRTPDTSRHLVAFTLLDLLSPAASRRVYAPRSLRDTTDPADYVVIFDPRFSEAASRLAALRSMVLAGIGTPVAISVNEEDIYNNFSGGLKDPYALRDFLQWLHDESFGTTHPLQYVCFLGDASRDYRNFLDHDPTSQSFDFVPTIVRNKFPTNPHSSWYNEPYASDDAMASFEMPPPPYRLDIPDLACGRLTVTSAAEAVEAVSRIETHTLRPPEGIWRNRMAMVADDLAGPTHTGQYYHTEQAEILTNDYAPASLDAQKIYLVEYDSPPGDAYNKPEARVDAKRLLADGVTVFHYIGHGSNNVLADEQVLRIDDIYTLGNGAQRPLFLAFSCDVGVFDSPFSQSMAEVFVGQTDGGAIAAICASQVSWITPNDLLSSLFYETLFPGQMAVDSTTVGGSLWWAKNLVGGYPNEDYTANALRYTLFGDPALHLPMPLSGLSFAPDSADSLRGGRREIVKVDLSALALPWGQGVRYDLQVEDDRTADSVKVVYSDTYSYTTYYWLPGATVFRGSGTITDDMLEIPFKVPVQLNYGEQGRLRVVVTSPTASWADAMLLPVVQEELGAQDDIAGPEIELAFADARYRVRTGTPLEAAIHDTSGVSILGTLPSNSIMLEFDNSGFMSDVSESFVFDPGSYTGGRTMIPLPADLTLGEHRAAIFASDVLGNVGSDTLSFLLVAAGVTSIADATVFPNPTSGPCRLIFELSDPMRVEWSLFTLAGRRIKLINETFTAPGPKVLHWDGRDNWGDDIANGVYLYVLRGSWEDNEGRDIEQTGQIVIMK